MAAKAYSFDEATHTHTIGGAVVPGITTCIKPLYDFSAVPEHIMRASCAYGSAVHKMVEFYCLGALDEDSLDPMLSLPLAGFRGWLQQEKLNPSDFIVEIPMGDTSLMYGGIPDIILDGRAIVELKTRKVNRLTDSIQTVAQESLWKKNGGDRMNKEYDRYVLELRQDGTFFYTKVNDKQAWPRFRKLLDYYHDTEKIQSWRNK